MIQSPFHFILNHELPKAQGTRNTKHFSLVLFEAMADKSRLSLCLKLARYIVLWLLLDLNIQVECIGEVIFAVNSGGSAHTDLNGVHYQADKLSAGISSDFGKNVHISRVAPPDQILYQTERYHVADFGYTIPIKQEGDFVLVLKFSEVYFRGSKLKVPKSL